MMRKYYKRPFLRFAKKSNKSLGLAIELAVRLICEKPDSGERKVADLVSVRVYKFRFQRQEYLLAYRVDPVGAVSGELSITFLLVGTHENFYDELKRYLHSDLN